MWWVDHGRLQGTHAATVSLPLLDRTEGENRIKKVVCQDKEMEITYQLPSLTEQTQHGEN